MDLPHGPHNLLPELPSLLEEIVREVVDLPLLELLDLVFQHFVVELQSFEPLVELLDLTDIATKIRGGSSLS